MTQTDDVTFEEDPPRRPHMDDADFSMDDDENEADPLLLNIDGFEGPIDVLLAMARDQKVDLTKISILQLARQYLAFIDRAKERNLELAAEYLVMAAWLAYLKSRLLLPREENSAEPDAQAMAEALQFQLRRLEAIQKAATDLFNMPQLGQDIFARGMPEGLTVTHDTTYAGTLYDLLRAYGDIQRRKETSHYELPKIRVMSLDEAMERMTKMLGALPRNGPFSVWTTLQSFVPEDVEDKLMARSSLASTLTAGLELVKQGKLEIKQDGAFRPVYLREKQVEAGMKQDNNDHDEEPENTGEESYDQTGTE